MDANGVRELLKIKLARAGFKSRDSAAAAIGICEAHLSGVQSGKDKPGMKILRYLGLKRTFVYEYEGLSVPAISPSAGKR